MPPAAPGLDERLLFLWERPHTLKGWLSTVDHKDVGRRYLFTAFVYAKADGPSEFAHPLCPNTWRNGKKIGDESKATATDY
jgi:hypothetical protein